MPLQPSETEIPLNLGMATKPSTELQEPSSMRLVQNLHWRGLGEVEARPAQSGPGALTAPSGSVFDVGRPCGLVKHGQNPLVVTAEHGVAMPLGSSGYQWLRGDSAVSTTPSDRVGYAPVSYDLSREFVLSTHFGKDSVGISVVAYAQYEDTSVLAWIDVGDSSIQMKAWNTQTRAVVATRQIKVATAPLALKACEYTESGKEGVLIAYIGALASPYVVSTIRYDAATNAFVDDVNLSTNVALNEFDIVKYGNRIMFAYKDNTSGFLTAEYRTIGSISSTHTANHAANYMRCIVGAQGVLIVSSTATTAYAEVYGTPANVINFVASSEVFHSITGAVHRRNDVTDQAVMWVNAVTTGAPTSTRVRERVVTFTSTTPTWSAAAELAHHTVIGHAFTLQGAAHVTTTFGLYVDGEYLGSPTTAVVSRLRISALDSVRHDVVARICHGRYYRADTTITLIDSGAYVEDGEDVAWLALTADPSEYPSTGVTTYPQTVFVSRISAKRPMPMPYADTGGGTVLVAGAQPWEFDGWVAAETAPIFNPVCFVDASSGSGHTATTGHSFRAALRWVDAAGRLHRSLSLPVDTGAFTDNQVDLYVSYDSLSAYDGSTTTLLGIDVYITEDGGSSYYLANDSSGGKLYHTSITSDGNWYKFTDIDVTDRSSVPMPYVNEIEPEHPPAFVHVATISDRMWAIDAEDRSRVWYSKPMFAGFAVEWSVSCTLTIGDECVAVVDSGGYPTVLAKGGLYQIGGPGPDATGGGGSFSPAQRLPFPVECVDPVSVCRTPLGVVFRGRRGLYALADAPRAEPGVLMDPDMLVDPANDEERLRVAYHEQANEIHVVTPDADRLVYNVLEQKWSRYDTTDYDVHDVAIARGQVWTLEQSGDDHYLLSEALYSQDGATYNASNGNWAVETPWYRFDQVAGQVRLWRAWFALKLASDPADATVSVSFYADWDDTAVQTVTWSGSELSTLAATDKVAQLPFAPSRQVVRAFKFRIETVVSGTTSAPKPLAMRLKIGQRPGAKTLRAGVKG